MVAGSLGEPGIGMTGAASMNEEMPRKLAFVHIPKTAGMSLTHALHTGWPCAKIVATSEELAAMSDAEVQQYNLIAGYFYAHQIEQPRFAGFDVVTLIRNPMDRFHSAWRFARMCVEAGLPTDAAMRYAAAVPFSEWAFSPLGVSQQHTHLYILGLNAGDRAEYIPLDDLLTRAKARLDRMLVGVVEQIDNLLRLVFRRHGRGPVPAAGRHLVTGGESGEIPLSRAQHEALLEVMRPDFELYKHARDLLLRRLEQEQAAPP